MFLMLSTSLMYFNTLSMQLFKFVLPSIIFLSFSFVDNKGFVIVKFLLTSYQPPVPILDLISVSLNPVKYFLFIFIK